jgi:hypothetical protein
LFQLFVVVSAVAAVIVEATAVACGAVAVVAATLMLMPETT